MTGLKLFSRVFLLALVAGATGWVMACGGGDGDPSSPSDDEVASIQVTPSQAELTSPGQTVQLTATALNAAGNQVSGVSFQWSSSNPQAASVSGSGLVTAQGRGSATITASARGAQGTAQIAVNLAVATVEVTPATAELTALGQTVQLQARARTSSGDVLSGLSVQWSSSAPGVASVNQQGLVTAEGNGSATITATVEGVQGTAGVTVAQTVESVEVTPGSASRSPGGQVQFSAEAQDGNGFEVTGVSFTWASSDESVATVDQSGLATALAEGNTTISATTDGGVTGTAVLSVIREVASVEVTPATAQLDAIGATAQFTAEATDDNGDVIEDVSFTWTSSDESVATVDTDGLATATGNGSTTITAEADEITGNATLTVEQVATSVEVTPESATTTVGSTAQFTAEALDANGNPIDGAGFQWSSNDEAVATVDQNGLATGQAEGTAEITATHEGLSDVGILTVEEAGSSKLRLVSGDGQNGKTQRDFADPLVVEALDANGDPEAGVTVTWSVVEGDATVSQSQVQTDDQGRAGVTLTAGKELTTHRIEASADGREGSPVEFTARTTVLVVVLGEYYFRDPEGRENEDFEVTVAVGDTIEFLNEGSLTHTATSDEEPEGGQAFDSGNMANGDTFRWVPDATGVWEFLCTIHPTLMSASLTVN